jgi:GNAT superfamily N-acetyltransferase
MNIIYKVNKVINTQQLQDLFLSVDWASGKYPDKISEAMKNSDTVYTAWDGETLIGLINVLDDGIMTAYIHFLLIRPSYQSHGVGRELLRLVKEKYKSYLRLVLISYDQKVNFYKNCGFDIGEHETPMFLTSLEN